MIGQKGIPSQGGGVEAHVEELSTRLFKAGHEVIVYTRPSYSDKNSKEYKGVKLISLPSIKTKNLDAISHTFLACLDLIFKRRKVDIVHFHAIGPSSLIFLIRIFRPSIKVVSTFHCQDYYHQKWSFFAKLYLKLGEYACCKFSNKTIAVSKELKKYAENKYGSKIVYIPNGVNRPEILETDEIVKLWGLKKDDYILIVSRLVRHKGIHHLIKAYKEIKTDKKLVIVGEGAYTDDYVQEIKNLSNENKNIIFTGKQSGKVLGELFSNAYLFVQPSEYEGLSIALLEAMSYALPVIISDIPENLESAQNNGLKFENKNYLDLKKQLVYAINNKEEIKKMGRNSRERVTREYDLDKLSKETIELYKSLVK